jgi:hypothetical protein
VALIYKAVLNPSKLGLLSAWLPSRPWFTGAGELRQVGAYRFDDPAGEVGLEALLVRSGGGPALHVPLTYRGMPLAGAEEFLVGTAEHSVLGSRWVYDGCGDPVWATALAATALTGGTQVEEFYDIDGRLEPRVPTATVRGSGTVGTPAGPVHAVNCRDEGPTTVVRCEQFELVVVRVVGAEALGEHTLTGSWADGGPAVLASVRRL